MTQFFELPDDVLLMLYKKLSPHELVSMISAGERLRKFRSLPLDALFMQQSEDARICQQKRLEYYMHHPTSLLVPSEKLMFPALKHMNVLSQLMGLSALNGTVDATKQVIEPYIAHLITQSPHPAATRSDVERLLYIAPMLNSNHIEQIIPQLKKNLSHSNGLMRATSQELLKRLAHRFTSAQFNTLIDWIKDNLQHNDPLMRTAALYALTPLAGRLTAEEIAPLMPGLLENVEHNDNSITQLTLQALYPLASRVNAKQAELLLVPLPKKLTIYEENIRLMVLRIIKIIMNKSGPEEIFSLIPKIKENLIYVQSEMQQVTIDTLKTLISKDKPKNIHSLIDETLTALNQPQNILMLNLNTLNALAGWFTPAHICSVFPILLKNLLHPSSSIREAAGQTLKALAPQLKPEQITQLITFIQEQLKNSTNLLHLTTLKAFKALARVLDSERFNSLLPNLLESINLDPNMTIECLNILEEQANKVTLQQATQLLPMLQEYMNHRYDGVRRAAERTLKVLIRQPQNESLAQEIMTWTMKSLNESQNTPEFKKWWQGLLVLDEDSKYFPSMLSYLQPKDHESLYEEAINWMRNKIALGNRSLPPTLLSNLLEQLDDTQSASKAKNLLSIACNSNIEGDIRDTALQALGNWSIVLLQEPQKHQQLLNTLAHALEEEIRKANNPVDKYSTLLQVMKLQISHEPILTASAVPVPQ